MAAPKVDKAHFVELLRALSSSENATRRGAETVYQQAKQESPDSLMIGMMTVLGSEDVEETVRSYNAILLRQLVMRGSSKDFVFARLSGQSKQEVAAELLRRFEVETLPKLRFRVGDVISKLAEYVCDPDDPRGSLEPDSPSGWPALLPLVFRQAHAAPGADAGACEAALKLLTSLFSTLKDDVIRAKAELGQVIQAGLSNASVELQTETLALVCEVVAWAEKVDWAPLLQTVGPIVQVLQRLAVAGEETLLQRSIQALTDVAQWQPDFFKVQLSQNMEPAKFMATVSRSQNATENSGLRCLALEWLVSYLSAKGSAAFATKHLKDLAPLVLQVCMDCMLEADDDQASLKAWFELISEEQGEEDEDELMRAGEQALDRVVGVLQMEAVARPLFQLIGHFAGQESWQAKHAALAAVRQTAEYLEENGHVDEMARLLLQHVDHPHPRVRYAALHALGQLANDQSPHVQEAFHQTVMPMLLRLMDDPIDRVASMAMSAFVSFGEDLDTSLMLGYADRFMDKFVVKLRETQHRGIRQESITSIAVIAGVLETDFLRYYDGIMPMLQQFVIHATSEKENTLRGKSFECMSLLGVAVCKSSEGKEKFLPDARDAIAEMLKTPLEADDVQREYLKEAWERICQCLKRDFAQFLPAFLPGLLKTLRLEDAELLGQAPRPQAPQAGCEEDDSLYVEVSTGDGKLVQVQTRQLQEIEQSIQLIQTFSVELEGGYFDWAQGTAEALLPLLSTTDQAMHSEDIRWSSFQTWGLLIKVARAGSQERGLPHELAETLLRTGLQHTFKLMAKTREPNTLACTASGVTQCIKNVGPGILKAEETSQLVLQMFTLIDQSLERTRKESKKKKEEAAALPRELASQEDGDQPDGEISEEEQLRRNYEEVLGAVMEVSPDEFLPFLPLSAERMGTWLQARQNKVLALYLACDLLGHLQERCESTWHVFMPEVLRSLGDLDADARRAAAYAINLAAPIASFAQAAPDAFRGLAQYLSRPRPKKRDVRGRMAFDNAAAALLALAAAKADLCPPEVEAWRLVVRSLPLGDDTEVAEKVHEKVVDMVMAQHEGLLGGAARSNLGALLSVLAEVYHDERVCSKKTEAKILRIFTHIPKELLQSLASGFTEKQQKKIEKMFAG